MWPASRSASEASDDVVEEEPLLETVVVRAICSWRSILSVSACVEVFGKREALASRSFFSMKRSSAFIVIVGCRYTTVIRLSERYEQAIGAFGGQGAKTYKYYLPQIRLFRLTPVITGRCALGQTV